MTKRSSLVFLSLILSPALMAAADVVTFPSGGLILHGVLFKPEGAGPFPAVVNHGSAPGMLSKDAFEALARYSRRTGGCSSDRTDGAKAKCFGWAVHRR